MHRSMRVNEANRNGLGRFYFVLGLFSYLLVTITCSLSTAYKTLQGEAQGSTYTIQFEAPTTFDVKQLHTEISQLLTSIDESMSTYVESSIISRLNRSEGDWFQVDDLFMRVLLSATSLHTITEQVQRTGNKERGISPSLILR